LNFAGNCEEGRWNMLEAFHPFADWILASDLEVGGLARDGAANASTEASVISAMVRLQDVAVLKSTMEDRLAPEEVVKQVIAARQQLWETAQRPGIIRQQLRQSLSGFQASQFPAFKKALEKLFPPDTEGIELECDADVAIKKKTRMRAKVDEKSREGAPWPRAEKLGDCLRASVVVAGAEQVVAAYEALAKDDIFKVVRLKNKLAERAKPFNLHVNLAFQPPAPPGLAPRLRTSGRSDTPCLPTRLGSLKICA